MVEHQFIKCINDKPHIEWLHLWYRVVGMVIFEPMMSSSTALGRDGSSDGIGQAASSQGGPTLAQPMHSTAERSSTRARAR